MIRPMTRCLSRRMHPYSPLPTREKALSILLPLVLAACLAPAPGDARGRLDYSFTPPVLVNDEGAAGIRSSTESSGQRAIAVLGDSVYAAWADERVLPGRVYLAKSEDGGAGWGPNVAVTDSAAAGAFPALAVSPDGTIHVVWQDFRPYPLAKVYTARSIDGGLSFEPSLRIGASTGETGWDGHPAIACAGDDTLYAAWLNHLDFASWVYVARSLDGGLSWDDPVPVESRCRAKGDPVIAAAAGGRVTVAWEDRCDYYLPCGFDDSFCGKRIYLARSFDGGATFRSPRPATPLRGPATGPSLAMKGSGDVGLAWSGMARRDDLPDIYFALNPLGGYDYQTSDLVQVDGTEPGTIVQDEPSLALDEEGNALLSWRDGRLGGSDIYFAAGDTASTFGAASRVTAGAAGEVAAGFPSVAAASGGIAHVLWTEEDPAGGYDTYACRGFPAAMSSAGEPLPGPPAPDESGRAEGIRIVPHPAGPGAVLSWPAPAAPAVLSIYDVTGRRLISLAGTPPVEGVSTARWDGMDASGRFVPPGVYFARTEGPGTHLTERIVTVR